jgi:hypothetical protein
MKEPMDERTKDRRLEGKAVAPEDNMRRNDR